MNRGKVLKVSFMGIVTQIKIHSISVLTFNYVHGYAWLFSISVVYLINCVCLALSPTLPYSLLISQTLARNLLNSPNSKEKCFCLNLFSRVTSNYICKGEHTNCLSLLFGCLSTFLIVGHVLDRREYTKYYVTLEDNILCVWNMIFLFHQE